MFSAIPKKRPSPISGFRHGSIVRSILTFPLVPYSKAEGVVCFLPFGERVEVKDLLACLLRRREASRVIINVCIQSPVDNNSAPEGYGRISHF
jgi:hypothetical protein